MTAEEVHDEEMLSVTDDMPSLVDPDEAPTDAYEAIYEWLVDWEFIKDQHKVVYEFSLSDCNWRLLLFPRGCDKSGQLGVFVLPLIQMGQTIKLQYGISLRFGSAAPHVERRVEGNYYDIFSLQVGQEVPLDRGFHDMGSTNAVSQAVTTKGPLTIRFTILSVDNSYKGRAEDPSRGFVGLRNQGATCYMNSLLQTLYALPQFRKAVFDIVSDEKRDSDNEKPEPISIPLALQEVFVKLYEKDSPVSTEVLTKSFGWTSMDSAMQHDVQEFSRVLLDSLEETTKGTGLENIVPSLFQGETESFVECLDIESRSTRTEKFYDLALNVKGCTSLEKSLDQYLAVEILNGANQFRTEKHGLRDARKGVKFLSLPPVLQFQLKRFEYDMHLDRLTKVNDRFEFPVTLDMSKFCPSGSLYHLLGVLVHSGGTYGGHYYCFIRPISGTDYSKAPWVKFDDDRVSSAIETQAVDNNFGGYVQTYAVTNAYMLVYVRQDHTICEVDVSPPQLLIDRIQKSEQEKRQAEDRREDEAKRKAAEMEVFFVMEGELETKSVGPGLTWDALPTSCVEPPTEECLLDPLLDTTEAQTGYRVTVDSSLCVDQWIRANSTQFVDKQGTEFTPQLWNFEKKDQGERPAKPVFIASTFSSFRAYPFGTRTRFYLRSGNSFDAIPSRYLVILKYFDIPNQVLRLLGSVVFSTPPLLSTLYPIAAKWISDKFLGKEYSVPEDWLAAYEETDDSKAKPIDNEEVLGSGDIVIFERRFSEDQLQICRDTHKERYLEWLQSLQRLKTEDEVTIHAPPVLRGPMRRQFFDSCHDYLPFLASRIVIFPQRREQPQASPKGSLMLQTTMEYLTVVTVLGKWLGVDPLKLRLYVGFSDGSMVDYPNSKKLVDLCSSLCEGCTCIAPRGKCPKNTPARAKLVYDIADFSFDELKQADVFEVHFMELFEATSYKFLVPKRATGADVLQAFQKSISGGGLKRKTPEEDRHLILVSVSGGQRRVTQIAPTATAAVVGEGNWVVQYALEPPPDSKVVWLWRFYREAFFGGAPRPKPFENPMQMIVKQSDTVADVKVQLQAMLKLDKVTLWAWSSYDIKELSEEDALVWDLRLKNPGDYYGVDLAIEAPPQPKKQISSYFNQGVKFSTQKSS